MVLETCVTQGPPMPPNRQPSPEVEGTSPGQRQSTAHLGVGVQAPECAVISQRGLQLQMELNLDSGAKIPLPNVLETFKISCQIRDALNPTGRDVIGCECPDKIS